MKCGNHTSYMKAILASPHLGSRNLNGSAGYCLLHAAISSLNLKEQSITGTWERFIHRISDRYLVAIIALLYSWYALRIQPDTVYSVYVKPLPLYFPNISVHIMPGLPKYKSHWGTFSESKQFLLLPADAFALVILIMAISRVTYFSWRPLKISTNKSPITWTTSW